MGGIKVYYGFYCKEDNEIVLTAKDYFDKVEEVAECPNGEDGRLYDDFEDEPYNYYSEINDAMWGIDCEEDSEAIYSMNNLTIKEVIERMLDNGFELIHNNELDE